MNVDVATVRPDGPIAPSTTRLKPSPLARTNTGMPFSMVGVSVGNLPSLVVIPKNETTGPMAGVGVGVGVTVGVAVLVAVRVGVGVTVGVGVRVGDAVLVRVAVRVAVNVCVAVGPTVVGVAVGPGIVAVGVTNRVLLAVAVGCRVGVADDVRVDVGALVGVCVRVAVRVGRGTVVVGVGVAVNDGGIWSCTRKIMLATAPTLPARSRSCTVSRLSPLGKRKLFGTWRQNCDRLLAAAQAVAPKLSCVHAPRQLIATSK